MEEDPKNILLKSLSKKELQILKVFMGSKNKIVTKEKLGNIIWKGNIEAAYSDWALDQAVSRFRKKLTKLGFSKDTLATVNGKGYIWRLKL